MSALRVAKICSLAGSMLVSAGGTEVCIWETLGEWGVVARLQNFQKTVTCVQIPQQTGPDSTTEAFLLAGSLDGVLRVTY
jgi:U3 small nucleolar RNA-associated protein 15